MKKFLIQSFVYIIILILPLLLKTLHYNYAFVDGMVYSLPFILMILIVLNVIGLVSVRLLVHYLKYTDGKDIVETWNKQEKIRGSITYKIINFLIYLFLFGLLIINGMFGTLILACLEWLAKYTFIISMQYYVEKFK